MLNSKKAIRMLPYAIDAVEKLDLISAVKNNKNDKKGLDLIKHVSKNIDMAEEEIFNIVAIYTEKTVEEVEQQSIVETLLALKDLFSDKDLIDFFKQAMQ